MFTDMKGFTVRTATQSRQQLQYLLELQDELIKPAIKHFDGNIVKTIGDAFMVAFDSPTDAVLCGMKIQENVLNHNVRAPSTDQMEVRLAINSGEVNIKDNDIFGEPVNIAARIEAIAEPNEVYFTEAVYLAMNKNEIPSAEVGHRRLKGIPEEIKVYKVVSEQTNLIRAKLKRQEQATAHANLSKDELHESAQVKAAEILTTAPAKTSLMPENDLRDINEKNSTAQIKDKKSFWQKHKKKILIAFILLLILMIFGIANDKKKLQQELTATKYPLEQLQEKIPEFITEFDKAVKDNDKDKVSVLIGHMKAIVVNAPPELKTKILNFAQDQLNNPELSAKNKQELNKIIKELE